MIRNLVKERGWKLVGATNEDLSGKNCGNGELPQCNIHWVDVANINERLTKMQPWQRFNHFPGMPNIARKAKMAQNLEGMRREHPRDYNFYPRTWILPLESGDFKTQFDAKGKSSKIFIIKPDAGCQGRGIFLTQDLSKVPTSEAMVAQQYIRKPLLIDGFKFDLRCEEARARPCVAAHAHDPAGPGITGDPCPRPARPPHVRAGYTCWCHR